MFRQLPFAATLLGAFVGALPVPCSGAQLSDVEHIIVIYLENHSFDNLFGFFPNADGIAAAGATKIQVDPDGHPYTFLPPVQHLVKKPDGTKGAEVDDRFPDNLPNQPFSIDAFVPIGEATGDLLHRYYDQIEQIDGGRMDKFAAYSDARGLAMGFYDGSKTKLWDYAKRYKCSKDMTAAFQFEGPASAPLDPDCKKKPEGEPKPETPLSPNHKGAPAPLTQPRSSASIRRIQAMLARHTSWRAMIKAFPRRNSPAKNPGAPGRHRRPA